MTFNDRFQGHDDIQRQITRKWYKIDLCEYYRDLEMWGMRSLKVIESGTIWKYGYGFLTFPTLTLTLTLTLGLRVGGQGHWKWRRSIDHMRLSIGPPL